MDRIFTHCAIDDDGYVVRKFLSLREARHFCQRNSLQLKATGNKPKTQRDLYKTALIECGTCLF